MAKAPCPPCQHVEAFCLMLYGVGERRIRIWNARDGVTPYYIDRERKHEEWHRDEFAPFHTPELGDAVFVDLTVERCTALRTEFVEKWWDKEVLHSGKMSARWATKADAIRDLVAGDMEREGEPSLVLVETLEQRSEIVIASRMAAKALGFEPEPKRFS